MNGFWNRMLWRIDRWLATGRVARSREGYCRYSFDNHILVLGGGDMLEDVLEAIAARSEWAEREVVVLSSRPAAEVRKRLETRLNPDAAQLSLTLYYGSRTLETELRSCQVDKASLIFIIGEDGENGHDAMNVHCWKTVRSLRGRASQVAQCYLELQSSASIGLFHMLPQEAHTTVETTIVNRYESIVGQLLVGDTPQTAPYTLDRGLITADADRYVHLVVVGMTKMGYAFATTAAQLCHFPNFDETSARPLRTKITFLDPSADVKMNQFKGAYPHLFALSHSRYMVNDTGWMQGRPDERYGDFLDVEWQFLKGTTNDEWVRTMLTLAAKDGRQVLSIAFCTDSADDNFAQSIHLPSQLYPMPETEGAEGINVENAPSCPNIYVYQPYSGALLSTAAEEVLRLHNLIPFGERVGDYDPLQTRATAVAKRVNYLYQKETSGKQFESMPTDAALLDDLWQQLSLAEKMSNLHTAHSVYTHLRSLAMGTAAVLQPLEDPERLEALARVEHARWNLAKLLVGYEAMTTAERESLNTALASPDVTTRQEALSHTNRCANQLFLMKDLAPYHTLPEEAKTDIRTLSRHLPLAALPYISSIESDAY